MNKKEYQTLKLRMRICSEEDIISTSAGALNDFTTNDIYDDGWTPSTEDMRK